MKSRIMKKPMEKEKKKLSFKKSENLLPQDAFRLFEESLAAVKKEEETFHQKIARRTAFIDARNFLSAEIDLICGEVIDSENKLAELRAHNDKDCMVIQQSLIFCGGVRPNLRNEGEEQEQCK